MTFNVPPAAIRVPVQRRPGAHERVDLAFVWPSLEPPNATAKPPPQPDINEDVTKEAVRKADDPGGAHSKGYTAEPSEVEPGRPTGSGAGDSPPKRR